MVLKNIEYLCRCIKNVINRTQTLGPPVGSIGSNNMAKKAMFVDLRQWGEPFEKKYIQFSTEQIQQIAENFHNWQRVGYEQTYHNEPEYCYSATLDEIEKKGWSLVPSKYIEFRNRDEQIDFDTKMRQLQAEMRDLLLQEEESNKELKKLFNKLGYSL